MSKCPHLISVDIPSLTAAVERVEQLARINFERHPEIHLVLVAFRELAEKFDAIHASYHDLESGERYCNRLLAQVMAIANSLPGGSDAIDLWKRELMRENLSTLGLPMERVMRSATA